MKDLVNATLLAVQVLAIIGWIAGYRGAVHRLRTAHPGVAPRLFGTPERRRNGMDQFFGVVGFLLSGEHRGTGDRRLALAALLLRLTMILFGLAFVAMAFAPFVVMRLEVHP